MTNKKVKKALKLGTVYAVTAATTLNPAIANVATVQAEESQAVNEENPTSSTESTSSSSDSTSSGSSGSGTTESSSSSSNSNTEGTTSSSSTEGTTSSSEETTGSSEDSETDSSSESSTTDYSKFVVIKADESTYNKDSSNSSKLYVNSNTLKFSTVGTDWGKIESIKFKVSKYNKETKSIEIIKNGDSDYTIANKDNEYVSVPVENGCSIEAYYVVKDSTSETSYSLVDNSILSSNKIVVDNVSPTISNVKIGGEAIVNDSWYTREDENLTFTGDFGSNVGGTATVYVKHDNDAEITIASNSDGSYDIFGNGSKTGTYTIRISLVSDTNKKAEQTYTVNFDNQIPEVSATLDNQMVIQGENTYVQKGTKLTASVTNTAAGIDHYSIMKKNTETGEYEEVSRDNPYTINDSGIYQVRSYNNIYKYNPSIGNEYSSYDLNGGKEITVVESNPQITYKYNDDLLEDKWYNNGTATITVSDSVRLHDAQGGGQPVKLYVNGAEIDSSLITETQSTAEGNGETITYKVNLKDLESIAGQESLTAGYYTIKIVVTNIFGKETSSTSTYKYDGTAPELVKNNTPIVGITTDGEIIKYKENYYVDGNIIFNGNFNNADSESGIANVEFIKGNNVIYNGIPEKYETESKEDFKQLKFRVTDNAGNVSEIPLSQILQLQNIGSLTVDKKAPVIGNIVITKPNYTDAQGRVWYKTVPTFSYDVSDDVLLKDVIITVNGTEKYKGVNTDGKYGVDLIEFTGEVKIDITAHDVVNHETVGQSYTYNLDTEAPDGTVSASGVTGDNTSEGAYSNTPITLKAENFKDASGIKAINVYKDDKILGDLSKGDVVIKESGNYRVVAVDNVGNEAEKSVNGLNSSKVVIDTDDPSINLEEPTAKFIDKAGNKWFDDNSHLKYSFNDSNIKDFTVVDSDGNTLYKWGGGTSREVEVVPNTKDGKGIKVTATITDKSGKSNSVDFVYSKDTTAPSKEGINVTSDNRVVVGDKAIIDGKITVTGTPKEDGSGIKSIKFDGKEVSAPLNIEINTDGKHTLEVEDNVGHVSTFDVNKLLGDGTESVFDTEAPVITRTQDKGVTVDNKVFYNTSTNPTLSYEVTEPNINSSTIKVKTNNGEWIYVVNENGKVSSDNKSDNIKVTSTDANHFSVKVSEEGKVEVSVVTDDKLGHESSDTTTYYNDFSAPVMSKVGVTGQYNVDSGTIYTNNGLTFTQDAEDSGSGIDRYEVYKKDGENWNLVDKDINEAITEDGEYKVRVYDKVGNFSDITLANAFKTATGIDAENILVYDNTIENPLITEEAAEFTDGGKNWYSKHPTFHYKAEDTNFKYFDITVSKGSEVSKKTLEASGEGDITPTGSDGEYTVNYEFYDKTYNSKKTDGNRVYGEVFKYVVDTTAPTVSAKISDSETATKGGKTYYTSIPKVSFSSDDGEGIGDNKYFVDGVEVGSEYELAEGVHTVTVKDKLGNESKPVDLKSLISGKNETGDFVIDSKAPEASWVVPESDSNTANDGKIWYGEDKDITVNFSDDHAGIKYAKVKVNGVEIPFNVSDTDTSTLAGSVSFNTKDYTAGSNDEYVVTAEVEDNAGNNSGEVTLGTFYVDKNAPIGLKADGTTPSNEKGGKVFFNVDPVITLSAEDGKGIGIRNFTYAGETVEANGNSATINPRENDDNTVSVIDHLGKVTQSTLQNLLGWGSNEIIVDKESPTATFDLAKPESTEGNKLWYSKDTEFSVSFKDNHSGLDNAELKVNGTVVDSVKYNNITTIEGTLKGSTKGIKANSDYSYDIELVVTDNAGNTFTADSEKIYVDTDAPVGLSATASTPSNEKGGVVYFKTAPVITVSANDGVGVGVGGYTYNDKAVETTFYGEERSSNIVKVHDILGNESSSTLQSLLGWSGNIIVIDGEAPTAQINRDKADYGDNWYKNDVTFNVPIKDNHAGISSASLTINNVKVDNKEYSELNKLEDTLTGSTKGITANEDGSYNVVVTVTDNAGNTQTYTDKVYVDKGSIEGSVSGSGWTGDNTEEGVYTSENLTVTADLKSKLAGIASIALYKDNKPYGEVVKGGSGIWSISESGSYKIVATDNVGNTKEYTISGFNSNNIIIDKDIDLFKLNWSEASAIKGTSNKKWYKGHPTLTLQYSDKNIKSITVTSDDKEIYHETTNVKDSENGITIEPTDENKQDIHVIATIKDKAGNTSTLDGYYSQDNKKPLILKENISTPSNQKGGKVYFKEAPILTIEAQDDGDQGIGVGSYTIDGVEHDENTITLEEGSHSFNVSDKLGNATTPVSLQDMFNWNGNNIVIDGVDPTAKIKRLNNHPEEDKVDWYKEDVNFEIPFSDDHSGIHSAKLTINGVDVDSQTFNDTTTMSGTLTGSTSSNGVKPNEDNSFNISVVVTDNAGNSKTWTDKVYVDKEAIEGTVTSSSPSGDNTSEGVYTNKDLTITADMSDGKYGSGIRYVRLMNGNTEVSPDISKNGHYVWTIKDSGDYRVVTEDNVGNSREFSIGGLNSSKVIRDNEIDKFVFTKPENADVEYDGQHWFKNPPTFNFAYSDTNIKSVSVTANGEELLPDNKLNGYSDGISLTPRNFNLKNIEIKVSILDKAGNTREDIYTYSQDNTAPVNVRATMEAPSNQKGEKVYFKFTPTVTLSAEDGNQGIGISSYNLDGKASADKNIAVGEGSHTVNVSDRLGNTSEAVSLQSLLGWSGNDVVIDGTAPTISASIDTPTYKDGAKDWYNHDVSISSTVTDDNAGIDHTELVVVGADGEHIVDRLNSNDSGTDVKSKSLSGSTAGISADAEGKYTFIIRAVDNAGNVASEYRKDVYVDKVAPSVNSFVINGSSVSGGSESRYGFFINGATSVDVNVSDASPSSGMNHINYTLRSASGQVSEGAVNIENGMARVNIPNNWKGWISATATDNVNNTGASNMPDGIITEDSNFHVNHSEITLTLPEQTHKDSNGINLYNSDFTANVSLKDDWSGVRSAVWGIGDKQLGTISKVDSTDKNINVSLSDALGISGRNENNLTLWVEITDNVGHTSRAEQKFSVDRDAPVVGVTWNTTEDDTYYSVDRVATITVDERNFDSSLVDITGASGTLGTWRNDGTKWTNTITFDRDGDYDFNLIVTDRAGNASTRYSSGKFTIDKTNPEMSVSWNLTNSDDNIHYNKTRIATITVKEHNFDGSKINLVGDGTISSWTNNGDIHTATVTFDKDGEYSFALNGMDLANNAVKAWNSGRFIIDKTAPEVTITGVSEGTSYKKDLTIDVDIEDRYLNSSKTKVLLRGKNHPERVIEGTFDATTGKFTFSDFPDTEDTDDAYTLQVETTDLAGNITTKTVNFSVNRFGSKYSFDKPNAYINKPKDVVIQESNVDKLDLSKVRVVVTKDGKNYPVDSKYIHIKEQVKNGKYVYTYTVDKEAFKEDGAYTVTIYSSSDDGTEYTSASSQYSFVLDTTAPVIIISGVEENERYRDYSRTVTVEVRDLSGVQDIHIYVNGKEIVPNVNKDGIYTFEITEQDDPQSIKVEVVDLADNSSTSNVDNFFIQSNPWVFIVNQPWFKGGIVGLGALALFLIALIVKRRKDRKKEEEEALKETNKIYQTAGSSSSGVSSSSSNRGDLDEEDEVMSKEEAIAAAEAMSKAEKSKTSNLQEGTTESLDNDSVTTENIDTDTVQDETADLKDYEEAETDVLDDAEDSKTDVIDDEESKTDVLDDTEESKTDVLDDDVDSKTDVLNDDEDSKTDVLDDDEAKTDVMDKDDKK